MQVRVLFDKQAINRNLRTGWGVSFLIDNRILFDTGENDEMLIDKWVNDLQNYVITDSFSAFVSKTPFVKQKMKQWTNSDEEWIGRAGWQLLAHLAMKDDTLDNDYFQPYLMIIENSIHSRKNRVKDAMNSALIAIGIRNTELEAQAITIAKTIGKIDVDHGETSCKTPDAVEYIRKTVRQRIRNKLFI